MSAKRPVVNSNGQEFESVFDAACVMYLTVGTILRALKGLHRGYTASGHQWAYKDEFSGVWPEIPSKKRPVVRSDGKEYLGPVDAARANRVLPRKIYYALKVTKAGNFCQVAGYQFAYKDSVPKVWPKQKPPKLYEEPKPRKQKPQEPRNRKLICTLSTRLEWRPIPGISGYEVSSQCRVRKIGSISLRPEVMIRFIRTFRVGDHYFKTVDVMMLAFLGPKPYGHAIQKREDPGPEILLNLFYGPRKRKATK